MTRHALITAAGLVLAAAVVVADTESPSTAASSSAGFLYGSVETRNGQTITGFLRWDDEEAFWSDHFNGSKGELPYLELAEGREPDPDGTWWQRLVERLGGDLGLAGEGRVVAVRFGDLAKIEVGRGDEVVLTLRDGTELEVDGGSNDIGATVVVRGAEFGVVEVPWRKVASVTFAPAPADADPGVFRLRGTVTTDAGELAGPIQWDAEECLSTDILDGDTDDGRVKLEMGRIRSIERRDGRSALVTLRDGSSMVLSGTNDVNRDIRGILVDDPRFGRVEVPWKAFERAVFDEPGGSGPGYADFAPPRPLSGAVTTRGGEELAGRLVFDLDEAWSWEMLDGTADDLDYSIPFALVASLEPAGSSGTLVRLRGGEELRLEGSHDVDPDNDGVALLPAAGGGPRYVPWREIERIELD
ncbi:MAG TPA: hypothetical protein VLT32_21805 [Candidatus Sulfomarinibacteraceae bacterium]|nr:hypothetical protein [Candidatus Sulfomarinibacteraceae bacterium]